MIFFEDISQFLKEQGFELMKEEKLKYLNSRYFKKDDGYSNYLVIVKDYSTTITIVIVGKYPTDEMIFVRIEVNKENGKVELEKGWIGELAGEDIISFDYVYNDILGFLIEEGCDIISVSDMDDWFIEFYLKEFGELLGESIFKKIQNRVERIIVEIE